MPDVPNHQHPPLKVDATEILERITDAFFALDAEWRFTYVNQRAEAILNTPRDQLIGRVIWEVFPEAEATGFGRHYRQAIESATPSTFVQFSYRTGRWFEVSSYPGHDGLSVYFRDVSEREQFIRGRERQSDMLGAVNVGVWYCDLPFDELQWDRKVKEHFWLEPDARVTIDTFYERIHPEDRERTRQAIADSIENHSPYDVEYRSVSPENRSDAGEIRWLRAIGYTGYDAEGNPLRFDGITVDITEQKLNRLLAEEANRAKSEFLARMSHDLRTPLNAIGGYAQLIELEIHGPVTDGQRDALQRVQRAQKHLLTIINDILSFARLEAGQVNITFERVRIETLFDELRALTLPEATERGLTVSFNAATQDLVANADRERLVQVMLNLIGNALKFTSKGVIEVSAKRLGDVIQMSVADNGSGIPSHRLDAIFDPFVQVGSAADEQRKGVGLGLAISRELVRRMGGEIRVSSTVGKGSTFSITVLSA